MLEVIDWGLIEYDQALMRQEEFLAEVAKKKLDGFLIFCSHPPVVTLGRKTQVGDVFAWTGKQIEISRGGRATYHGPSQVVMYPIVNLTKFESSRQRDIHKYLRTFEQAIIAALSHFNIHAEARAGEDNTGVWVQTKKIASLGIGVRQWVTYHGAAINLDYDPQAFQGINPCGFQSNIMTSVEEQLGHKVDRTEFQNILSQRFIEQC